MSDIHVFVLCCAEYKDIVGDCIKSIKKYVDHNILSINVVSNLKIDIDGVNLILDHNFWKILDPNSDFKDLYKINWIRQQIFKLSVDQYKTGNILVVDAEVLFLKKMKWIEDNKTILYSSSVSPIFEPYFVFNKELLGFDKACEFSLIADAMLFSSKMLKSLRRDIEKIHHRPWLEVINKLILEDGHTMSEFETYGNYVLKYYPDTVNVVGPIKHVMDMYNRQDYEFDELINAVAQHTDNSFISVNIEARSYRSLGSSSTTAWLTFYEQVRDPSWPDCDNESDFELLPEVIKQECIKIFNYVPKRD